MTNLPISAVQPVHYNRTESEDYDTVADVFTGYPDAPSLNEAMYNNALVMQIANYAGESIRGLNYPEVYGLYTLRGTYVDINGHSLADKLSDIGLGNVQKHAEEQFGIRSVPITFILGRDLGGYNAIGTINRNSEILNIQSFGNNYREYFQLFERNGRPILKLRNGCGVFIRKTNHGYSRLGITTRHLQSEVGTGEFIYSFGRLGHSGDQVFNFKLDPVELLRKIITKDLGSPYWSNVTHDKLLEILIGLKVARHLPQYVATGFNQGNYFKKKFSDLLGT